MISEKGSVFWEDAVLQDLHECSLKQNPKILQTFTHSPTKRKSIDLQKKAVE